MELIMAVRNAFRRKNTSGTKDLPSENNEVGFMLQTQKGVSRKLLAIGRLLFLSMRR
jgi:hypothetical protein